MDEDELLTVAEVARRLRLAEETIRRWIRSGRLPAIRLGSDRAGFRIRQSDVTLLLAQGRQLPLPEDRGREKAAA